MPGFLRGTLLVAVAVLLASAQPAMANYGGGNGRIYFGYTGATTWSMNPDGTGAAQASDQSIVGPWSPDGTMMVHQNGFGSSADFTVWGLDGTKISDVFVPDDGHNPSFTPDGRIIYDATHEECLPPPYPYCYTEGLGVFVVNVDGTGNEKVLDNAIDAVWSPLGGKIAYTGSSDGKTALIVANADGSNPVPVAFGFIEPHPDWSPDGTRIAYVKVTCTTRCGYDIWSVRADSTDERQLTFTDNQERGVSWSPDRSKIAFVASDPELSGGAGIFTMNPDGSGITKLRDDGGYPFWRPFINRRPDCSGVTASPGALWPPNHKLVTVTLTGASDPDGDLVSLVVTGVSSDPPAGPSDGRTGPGQNQARVRAARGRTYEIAFDAGDDAGAHCFGTVSVAVTHG